MLYFGHHFTLKLNSRINFLEWGGRMQVFILTVPTNSHFNIHNIVIDIKLIRSKPYFAMLLINLLYPENS